MLCAAGLDHIGIAVRDLGAAEKVFRDLGFTTSLRGRLPDGIKTNSIDFKSGQYLELISITDRQKALLRQADLVSFLDKTEGPFFAAIETPSAAKTASQLRPKGFSVDGPAGNSWTLDGVNDPFPESWQRVRIGGLPVFFIEYHNEVFKPLEKQYPILKDDPARTTHRNGVKEIASVWIAVKDLDAATRIYQRLGCTKGRSFDDPALKTKAREMRLKKGSIRLVAMPDRQGVIGATLIAPSQSGCRITRPYGMYLQICGPNALRRDSPGRKSLREKARLNRFLRSWLAYVLDLTDLDFEPRPQGAVSCRAFTQTRKVAGKIAYSLPENICSINSGISKIARFSIRLAAARYFSSDPSISSTA